VPVAQVALMLPPVSCQSSGPPSEVRLPVDDVVELVGPDRVRQLGRQPRCDLLVVVVIDIGLRRHWPHLGAERAQQFHLLVRLVVRDDDHAAVAAFGADVRQPDAGVAGGALDDRAARAQRSALFGGANDVQGGPILDRAAGVEEFGLGEDVAAGFLAQPRQADQWRVADGPAETFADRHCRYRYLLKELCWTLA
jgi:hypothetical protein